MIHSGLKVGDIVWDGMNNGNIWYCVFGVFYLYYNDDAIPSNNIREKN